MEKYFPIKTETACQLKWTWSTIHMYTGETNSCHRVDNSILTAETFDKFHNTDKKINDRLIMLDGKWPSGGCEYCSDVELAGGSSDRQFHNQIPNLYPSSLDTNSHAVDVIPRIIEIYFDNPCNMSCIYCNDKNSSRIQAENTKFGDFSKGGVEIKNTATKTADFAVMTDKLWIWLDNNYHELRRLHILGGEPLIQPELDTFLEFLESHSNSELEVNIITNLKISNNKLQNYISRIKDIVSKRKIKRIELTCSIDCFGEEQKYIRHGINLDLWIQNFEYLVSQRWITLNINQTLTVLGMQTMVELLQYINKHRETRTIGHYFMECVDPIYLSPSIMGSGYFDNYFVEIFKFMPSDSWQHNTARELMTGLQTKFSANNRNEAEVCRLGIYLDEIDRRRNTDWRGTFPWLIAEIDKLRNYTNKEK